MVTSADAPSPPERRAAFDRRNFIANPVFDGIFLIGSPLLAIAAVTAALQFLPAVSVEGYVLTYMALGHHVPTFLRAYGDPSEFSQNRFRLTVIPMFVVPLVVLMYAIDSRLLALIFIWDQFHFVRQHYGLMRIYDAKLGNIAKSGNNLDQWLCFSWFVVIISHSSYYSHGFLGGLFDLGLVVPTWTGPLIRQSSLAIGLVVLVLFSLDLGRRAAYGQPISVLKILTTLTTYGAWYYAYTYISEPYTSYAISSLFHCLQYDAIAWYFNRSKATELAEGRGNRFFRWIHAPRHVWLYVMAILAYPVFCQVAGTAAPSAIYILNRTTGILHYYLDSFIWRVRRPAFRAQLQ